MSYLKRVVIAGETVEVKLYHSGRERPKGEARRKRFRETSLEQEEVNRKNAEDTLRWLLNTNFTYGDYHIVLNYQRKPDELYRTPEQMKDDVTKFIRKLRTRYKKQGSEMKFIYVMEIGEKGSRHIHFVLNKIDVGLIQDCWPHSRITCTPLDDTGNYWKLANYLMKYSDKTFRTVGALMGKRYSRSRNLSLPIIKKTVVKKSSSYKAVPTAIKGYSIVSDMTESGVDAFGYPFLKYVLVRCRI